MPVRFALLVVNPAAGRGRAGRMADAVESLAREAGISVRRLAIFPPAAKGGGVADGGGYAGAGGAPDDRAAHGRTDSPPRIGIPPGADAIVVIGGDGTLSSVANSGNDLPPILPVPAGTSNSVARELGISSDLASAVRALVRGAERRLDAIEWRLGGKPPARALLCVSVGFDAAVVRSLSVARRGTASYMSYAGPILKTLAAFQFDRLKVEADGLSAEKDATTAIICNTRRYGGPLVVAPSAVPDDGSIDLCAVRAGSRAGLILCAFEALFARTDRSARISLVRGKVFRITAPPGSRIPVQTDGEAAGFLADGEAMEARCLPGAVRVIAPPKE